MRRLSSAPFRRIAATALTCAALFAPPIEPSRAAPAATELTSAEAAWVPLVVIGSTSHGAVLDPGRDRMLVFGGQSGSGFSDKVRAFPLSGASDWIPISVAGSAPFARRSAGVAYDPVRDRLLVFGGSDGVTTYNDLWALSLAGTPHWSFLGSGGAIVPPREEHVAVYDAAHDRLVVFGGIDDSHHMLSDCWAYSLGAGTWSPLGAGGDHPLARQSAAGIYDPVRDRLIVFGGADSSDVRLSDTWALPLGAGGTWALLPLASGEPVGRDRAATAYDAGHDQMVVYGGRGPSGLLDGVLTLSLPGTATWNSPIPSTPRPAARQFASAIVDPLRDRLVVYGGGTPGPSADVVAFALSGTHPWTTLTPNSTPSPFTAAAMVRDPVRNRMLVFGGLGLGNIARNEVWSVNLNAPASWTRLTPAGTPPGARAYASAVYDAARDRVLVFGGTDFVTIYNDVWSLQLAGTPTWQLLSPSGTPPSARYIHTAIVDPVRDRMVLFGGTNFSTSNNEVWTLDLGGTTAWTSWAISDPVKPGARYGHGAIYDPVRDRMIIAYGRNLSPDVWALPLATPFHWQPLSPNGPAPAARYLAGWGYDPARDRLLLYGGRDVPGPYGDAWALQFGATDQWIALEPAGGAPEARNTHCAAFDPAGDRFVFAGGSMSGLLTSDAISIDWKPNLTGVPPASPLEIALAPPFPNPMREAATIRFVTTEPGPVEVAILDVSGRLVRTLEDEPRAEGAGLLRWDGRDERGSRVAPGVYLVQMRSHGSALSRRVVLVD